MATTYLSPIFNGGQQFTNAGNILVGGIITTFTAGTSTPQATFKDNAGSVSWGTSITLDSAGRVPNSGEIWLTAGVLYKFILTDSALNVIYTFDNIQGVNNTALANPNEWVTSGFVPTYISATSFSVPGNQTATLQVGRRIQTDGPIYSTILTSSFGGGITTVTTLNDSGSLAPGFSTLNYGFLAALDPSVPAVFPYPLTITANGSNLLTNIRLSKSANYTVANADKGATIALGGSAFFTLTFNAASGYDANFICMVVNEDSYVSQGSGTQGRGKRITLGAFSFILWPGQSFIAFNQNNTWHTHPQSASAYFEQRWKLPGQVTIFVDATNGSDSNDGMTTGAGGAVKTLPVAQLILYQQFDCNNFQNTVQMADGTYIQNLTINNSPVGSNVWYLIGNTTTPANVILQPSIAGAILQVNDAAEVITGGWTMNSNSISGCTGIQVHQTAIVDISYPVVFGTFTSGTHMATDGGGLINMNAAYTISGNASVHVQNGPRGYFNQAGALAIGLGASSFSGGFYNGNGAGCQFSIAPLTTYTGTCTAQAWTMQNLASILTNSNSFVSFSGSGNPATGPTLSTNGGWAHF